MTLAHIGGEANPLSRTTEEKKKNENQKEMMMMIWEKMDETLLLRATHRQTSAATFCAHLVIG